MSERVTCIQCGEYQDAIVASQRTSNPIFCGAVDYFGELEWDLPRHRFRDWTDKELTDGWQIKPEFVGLYRRIWSAYDIADEHRSIPLEAVYGKAEQ